MPLERLPDGRVVDTHYLFKHGDRVRITQGPHARRLGVAESAVFQWHEDGQLMQAPAYDVALDDRTVTVRVEWLEVACNRAPHGPGDTSIAPPLHYAAQRHVLG